MDTSRGAVRYAATLVEQAVLLAVSRACAEEQERFHERRAPIYDCADAEEREARFEALHGEWFLRLGLDRPLHDALGERPEVVRAVSGCRVVPARSRREELADLAGAECGPDAPLLVVRLGAASLAEGARLRQWLRHELLHVADMLDPRHGYRPRLPPSPQGPLADGLLRERYRVVWDVTVGGRLFRERLEAAPVRERLWQEFRRAFPALGDQAAAAFERWFEDPAPTHAGIAGFVRQVTAPPPASAPRA